MRLVKKYPILSLIYHTLFTYPSPTNLNYFWNFGSLALLCLILQIITGIFLAMHYIPEEHLAFSSVEHIMRDVNYGWFLRYMHANGASAFFFVIYIHIFRGLFYGSFATPREILWCTGVIILLIMILTAFLGYVLPWGQMSFWAATVITNLASAIPWDIGQVIVNWLWGGFSVSNATLNRFFSLHYFLPFILFLLSFLHLVLLHENGSNNPLGVGFKIDNISFIYYVIKDIYGVIFFFFVFFYFIFFIPNYLGHSDNYILANPLVTPTHIVPEWYFLPFYAILRSVPDKLLGVILLLMAIFILLILPFLLKIQIRASLFKPLYFINFWFFFFNCLLLGWVGGKPIETPFLEIGKFTTIFYFAYFLCIIPFTQFIENFIWEKTFNLSTLKKKIGALTSKSYSFKSRPWELISLETFDYFDSFLSRIRVEYRGTTIFRVNPIVNNKNLPWISDRVRFSYDSLYNQRLNIPLMKVNNFLFETSWDSCFKLISEVFLKLKNSTKMFSLNSGILSINHLDFIKRFFTYLGNANFFSNSFFSRHLIDFRFNFILKNFTQFLDFQVFIFVFLNLRIENPIFWLTIRNNLEKSTKYFFFGSSTLLWNSFFFKAGNSKLDFNKLLLGQHLYSFFLKNSKILILLGEYFFGKDIFNHLCLLYNLKKINKNIYFFFISSQVANILNKELFISSSIIFNFISLTNNFIYLCHINEIPFYLNNSNFLVYQGTHGDSMHKFFDIILPEKSSYEQIHFFINLWGEYCLTETIYEDINNSLKIKDTKDIYLSFFQYFFLYIQLFPLELLFCQKSIVTNFSFKHRFYLSSYFYKKYLLFNVNNIFYKTLNSSFNLFCKNSFNLTIANKLFLKKKMRILPY